MYGSVLQYNYNSIEKRTFLRTFYDDFKPVFNFCFCRLLSQRYELKLEIFIFDKIFFFNRVGQTF
jgi:hypothetical protein